MYISKNFAIQVHTGYQNGPLTEEVEYKYRMKFQEHKNETKTPNYTTTYVAALHNAQVLQMFLYMHSSNIWKRATVKKRYCITIDKKHVNEAHELDY